MANTGQYDSQTNIEIEDYEREIFVRPEAAVIYGGSVVNSVNGQVGDVVLTTSDLENTSDYQTGAQVQSAIAGKQDKLTAGSGLNLDGTILSVDTNIIATVQDVTDEATIRENSDANLQGQIDALTVSSDVIDVLGTYQDLQNYDTSHVKANDIIKVLQDSTHNNSMSYYRWEITDHVGSWVYVGSEGPYYTKSEADALLDSKQNTEDNSLDTTSKTIVGAINEVNSVAKGANQALSFANYSAMVIEFNSLAGNEYSVGQNIMVVTLEVPDLWISGIESTSSTYTYTTDEAFTAALATNGYVQVGYYKLSALETQKVDLTEYVKNTDYATSSVGGVIKTAHGFNVSSLTGTTSATNYPYSTYNSLDAGTFISKGTLDSVITGKGLVSNGDLATIATSGSYNDSTNKPKINNVELVGNKSLNDLGIVALDEFYKAFPTDTASGAVASFTDGADNLPLKSLIVNIDPIQDTSQGDPSPENICPISGWSEANVTRTGKNIVETPCPTGSTRNDDGSVTRTATSVTGGLSYFYTDMPSGTYTISNISGINLFIQSASGDYSTKCYVGASKTFTHVKGEYGRFLTENQQANTTVTFKWQVELGNEPTTYEPYNGNTYSITFPAAAGTVYGGTLDVTTGKLTVDRAMVDLGAKNWYLSTAAGRTRFRTSITDIERISSPNVRASLLCSNYPTKTANQTYQGTTGVSLQQNSADIYIYDPQTESMTTAEFKSAMSGVQLCYELATPQTYQLTPTEVTTLLSDNTIWADTGDTEVEYRADIKLYINKMIGDAETISTRLASGGRETALYKGAINPIETNIPLEEEGVEYEKT